MLLTHTLHVARALLLSAISRPQSRQTVCPGTKEDISTHLQHSCKANVAREFLRTMLLQNPPAEDEAQPTNYVGLQPSYAGTSLTQPPSHLPGTPGRPPEPLCGQTVAVATPGSPIARAPAAGLFCSCAGHPCTMRTTATRAAREANQHPRPTRQTPRIAPSPVVRAACASAAENRGRRRQKVAQT